MTQTQKLEKLKVLSGETDESVLFAFLELAGERILRRAYPFCSDIQDVPVKYHSTQLDIALYLLNKRGAEGETAHSENGISRSYESATVPDSMLKHITPHASVLGGELQMKCLERNKTEFYYALFVEYEPGRDEYGNESGEPHIIYSEPVSAKANISPATGSSQVEQFGKDLKYDKVIVLDDINCPIDENSVLFVDKLPERDEDGNLLFDYIVKKIAKSINSVSIAISKVDVS